MWLLEVLHEQKNIWYAYQFFPPAALIVCTVQRVVITPLPITVENQTTSYPHAHPSTPLFSLYFCLIITEITWNPCEYYIHSSWLSTLVSRELRTVFHNLIIVVCWFKILCALCKYSWIVFKFCVFTLCKYFIDCMFWTDHISLYKHDLLLMYHNY